MTTKMDRRSFLTGAVATCGLVAAIPAVALAKQLQEYKTGAVFDDVPRFGYVSAEGPECGNIRTLLNGDDVSSQCFDANDQEGWAGLYEMNSDGHLKWPVRYFRVYGDVVIRRNNE